jgi:GNAT superfamily N-acetyltransferase
MRIQGDPDEGPCRRGYPGRGQEACDSFGMQEPRRPSPCAMCAPGAAHWLEWVSQGEAIDMSPSCSFIRASQDEVQATAVLVGELLHEIMRAIDQPAFRFDQDETEARLRAFLDQESYFVFLVKQEQGEAIGFVSMYEGHALYAEGAFGVIAELFVRPAFRSQRIGTGLIEQAREFGRSRGWTRLEVTTPPLPQFERTLAFYQQAGFAITGGRKLKVSL